ncbi:MAG TPA: 50S ribosomal protein L11 methyltransferase [Verrucomicrobiae bacterium]|jgi:ribosomal protein L11 methyltransferase
MKTNKPLWRISVTTSLEAEDAVAELLGSHFGAAAAAYFNLETGVSIVSIFRDQKPDAKKVEAKILAGLKHIAECGLKIGAGQVEVTKVKREDWAESWKRHFKPIEIGVNRRDEFHESLNKTKLGTRPSGKTLLVKPSWSKKRPRKGQSVVILDPGLSFGTGQHPTTSFCLGEIARGRKPSAAQSFLDIGTGSGILAIAAAKLGYSPVHAFDFDPESVRVAKANARKNRVENKMKLTRGDVTKLPMKPARQYDLVCANLISTLLIAEKKRITNRLKKGGVLVLAGILAAEFSEVERAFAELKLKLLEKRVVFWFFLFRLKIFEHFHAGGVR